VQELLQQFVPATDEVGRLQRGEDEECRLFQRMAEQGHYAGRTRPTATRQGIYACAPSGAFLDSVNTRSADRVIRMLKSALEAWEALPEEDRYDEDRNALEAPSRERWEKLYPEDGLVLRVISRDLPRDEPVDGWHATAWNLNHAWFRQDEAKAFVPETLEAGTTAKIPEKLARRIAAMHLIDNVRGQTLPFGFDDVERAEIRAEVVHATDEYVGLKFTGETRAVATGTWPVRGFHDRNAPSEQERGVETTILGYGTWDRESQRFISIELVALGTRWGGTQYNARGEDLEPQPIGFLFTLGDEDDRIPPAHIWKYNW